MCNQVTNRVPYGLLSEEEQAQFCKEAKQRGLYNIYDCVGKWKESYSDDDFIVDANYRLIIKDDEWYYCDDLDGNREAVEGRKLINSEDVVEYSEYATLRPATPAEIQAAKPKVESLEDRVKAEYGEKYEVELLTHNDSNGLLSIKDSSDCDPHVILQSMKGFHMYVYENLSGNFELFRRPTSTDHNHGTLMPIAVLFTKECK